MNYTKLFKWQKTLALPKAVRTATIALGLVGAYCNMPLLDGSPRVQAQSATPNVSTATHTYLPTSRSMSGLAVAQSLPVSSLNLIRSSSVQVAQSATDVSAEGSPNSNNRLGAGTYVQNQPSLEGAPSGDQRQGAASRGTCPRVETPLTALVPLTKEPSGGVPSQAAAKTDSQTILGLTVSPHPTFWFYSPYQLTSARPVEFVLQDEDGNDVYQTKLTESGTAPGVVGFKLPSSARELEVNKKYKWFFLVYCNATPDSDYVHVEGWVRRVALTPSIQTQLEQVTPQQSVALYTKSDIWHEAVSSLAELRRKKPEDATLKTQWAKLLKSIDLEAYASEPISSVITLEK